MAFGNPIVGGGGDLIREDIQSPNFEPGMQGWQVNQDGDAQFNNVTIIGEFDGTDFVIDSAGIFFYG